MVGVFIVVSLVLWYAIEWVKKVIDGEMTPRRIAILVLALACGVLLAFQFRLDAFVMASQFVGVDALEPSLLGKVFAGIVLASGSAGIFELLKALKGFSAGGNPEEAYTVELEQAKMSEEEADVIANRVLKAMLNEQRKPPNGEVTMQ